MIIINKFYILFLCIIIFIALIPATNSSNYYYPVENHYYISSYFGYRELYGSLNFHTGIDFPVILGTEVHAFSSGVVQYASFLNGYGNCIIITHENNYRSLYAHLSEHFIVKVGDYVYSNQVIAYVGPTILSSGIRNGNTTGVHLHFELYNEKGSLIDPLSLNYSN